MFSWLLACFFHSSFCLFLLLFRFAKVFSTSVLICRVLFWGLNGQKQIECLAQFLAHMEYSITGNFYYLCHCHQWEHLLWEWTVALHIGEASDHIKWSGLFLTRKLRSFISGHTLRLNLHSQQQRGSWPLWIRGRQLERAKEGLPEDYNGQGKAEITILKDNLCSNYHLKVHGK